MNALNSQIQIYKWKFLDYEATNYYVQSSWLHFSAETWEWLLNNQKNIIEPQSVA